MTHSIVLSILVLRRYHLIRILVRGHPADFWANRTCLRRCITEPKTPAAAQEGEGLGAKGSGIAAPVSATGAAGYSTLGLGASKPGDPTEGGDSFEVYRQRMMLGCAQEPRATGLCKGFISLLIE